MESQNWSYRSTSRPREAVSAWGGSGAYLWIPLRVWLMCRSRTYMVEDQRTVDEHRRKTHKFGQSSQQHSDDEQILDSLL